MKSYELLSRFQYRTPLLSIDAMNELLRAINKEGPAPALRAFFFQPLIAEALYIGSGSLFERFKVWAEFGIEDKNDEERLLLSLLKYAIRMSARCTPFGLFAGVGTGNWSSHEHNFVLTSPSKVCKHISLDADYVYNISLTIQEQYPEIKLTLRYFSNTTLFKVGNSFRYISYTLTARRRIYQLQTVGWSAYLEKVIEACRSGQTASDIIQLLLTFEVSTEEATSFFFQLIDNQLLVSELEPRIGDGDYFEQAYDRMIHNPELNTLPALFPVRNEFARIKESVSSLTPNHPNFLDFPGAYDRLKFQQLTPRIPVQHHFLVNSTRPAVEASLNSRIGSSLRKALSLLNFLTFKSADNTLTEFRTQFKQRYEDRAVPLLEVLDPEIGIASHYNAVARDEHPFLVGFNFDGTSSRSENTDLLSWNPGYGMLLKKLIHEKTQAPYVLHIEEEDLKTFTENWEDTPV
ncbi:MAG: lantibiotic dehydratase, partial [Saprospiraceae bacterium]|nr:lantibiotic dehydratase [Saprospiraceae bacterium]